MAEARRTRRFWFLSATSLAMALGLAGLIVHLVPLFRDLGAGARSLVIGVAPVGGCIPSEWAGTLIDAVDAGLDVVAGLMSRCPKYRDRRSSLLAPREAP